jgi:hypothetical protein
MNEHNVPVILNQINIALSGWVFLSLPEKRFKPVHLICRFITFITGIFKT